MTYYLSFDTNPHFKVTIIFRDHWK